MADKSALLTGREERDLVVQGKAILEDQRDLLAQQMLAASARLEALQPEYERLFAQARRALRCAVLRHGSRGVAAYAVTASALPAPRWRRRNLSGALLLGDANMEPAPLPEAQPGWDVSPELDAATVAFHELVRIGVNMAALDNDLARLCHVFSRTQRRVNALENVVLPELVARIRGIEEALEDAERENVVRARLARARASAGN